jgi:hypothetical protein
MTAPTISIDLVRAATRSDESFFASHPPEVAVEAADRYSKFLFLCKKYPEEPLSPSKDIDEMWHIHMLNPRNYYHDCMENFGELLDHDGGFGSDSPEQWQELLGLFRHTADLWEKEFGTPYTTNDELQGAMKCAKACAKCAVKCRTACKKYANKAVDSTATRVTPPASSLRSGQESRHGQP